MRNRLFFLFTFSLLLIHFDAIAGNEKGFVSLVNNNGILSQRMFEDDKGKPRDNTIFIVKYDYNLIEDITIPANSTLKFEGGKINGKHKLTGNNTKVEVGLDWVFDVNTTFKGSWMAKEVYPEWFGANGNDKQDDTLPFQKAIDFAILVDAPLYLCNANYCNVLTTYRN